MFKLAGLLLILCWPLLTSAANVVELETRLPYIAVGSQLQYFTEGETPLDISALLQQDASLDWQPLGASRINLGFRTETFWFKVALHNDTPYPQEWLLEQSYPLVDQMELYLVEQNRVVQRIRAGDQQPFRQRPVLHPEFLFPLSIPGLATYTLYLRVANTEALEVPLMLWQRDAYIFHDNGKAKIEGMFYGVMLVMALYNLVLSRLTRDRNYRFYSFYVIAFMLMFASQRGDLYAWLYPESPWLQHVMIPVTLLLAYITGIQFARGFLRLPEQLPGLDRIFKLLLAAAGILLPLIFVLDYHQLILLIVIYQVPLTVTALLSSFLLSMRGQRTAQIYLLGWSLLLLNLAGNALAKVGLIESDFFYIYGLRAGAVFEVVLFSVALAYRYNEEKNQRIYTERQLSREREKNLDAQKLAFDSERALRRLRETMLVQQKEANERLEQMVQNRTADLERTLQDLEQANNKLALLSEEDALTGLKNRRYLDRRLQDEWHHSVRSSDVIALLMIDIDHFKQLNDQFGHRFGDSVLQQVANIIANIARRSVDIAARWGGEEFALVLPGTDECDAIRLAQKLKSEIQALILKDDKGNELTTITISVGVNCQAPDSGMALQEWIELADRALYFAKNNGRNCIGVANGERFHCV